MKKRKKRKLNRTLTMSDFPIPTTKVQMDKRKKTRQQQKINIKKQVDEERNT